MFSGKGAKYELVLGSDLMQSDPVTLTDNGFAPEQEYSKKFKIEDIDNVTNIKIIRGEGQKSNFLRLESLPFACSQVIVKKNQIEWTFDCNGVLDKENLNMIMVQEDKKREWKVIFSDLTIDSYKPEKDNKKDYFFIGIQFLGVEGLTSYQVIKFDMANKSTDKLLNLKEVGTIQTIHLRFFFHEDSKIQYRIDKITLKPQGKPEMGEQVFNDQRREIITRYKKDIY